MFTKVVTVSTIDKVSTVNMVSTVYGDYDYGLTYFSVKAIVEWLSKGGRVITNIPLNRDAVGAYVKKKRGRFDASRLVLLNDAELTRSSPDVRFKARKALIVIRETPILNDSKFYLALPYAASMHKHYRQDWLFCVRDCDSPFNRKCFMYCGHAIRVMKGLLLKRYDCQGLEYVQGSYHFGAGFYDGVSYGRYFFDPEICELIPSVEVNN